MAGQFDEYVGELTAGETGWLPLDESGNPTGPATREPPPPPALACPVMVNPEIPLPEGHSLLLSEAGAELVPPLQPRSDPRDPDTYVPPVPEISEPPVIISLSPNSAVSGDPDLEMSVNGTGFTIDSVIVFAGQDEPTDYFSPTLIGTGVKPSLFAPAVCPVTVRNPTSESNSVDFTFTDPAKSSGRRVPRSN